MEICEQAKAEVCCWLDYDSEAKTLCLSLRGRDKILLVGPAENEPVIFRGGLPNINYFGLSIFCLRRMIWWNSVRPKTQVWHGLVFWSGIARTGGTRCWRMPLKSEINRSA